MNAPMRALAVKSPKGFQIVKHTSIDTAEVGPPPRAGGPRRRLPAFERHERITRPESNVTDIILSWRLLWSVASLRPRPTPIRVSLMRLTTK